MICLIYINIHEVSLEDIGKFRLISLNIRACSRPELAYVRVIR